MDTKASGLTIFIALGKTALGIIEPPGHPAARFDRHGAIGAPGRCLQLGIDPSAQTLSRGTQVAPDFPPLRWSNENELLALLWHELDAFMRTATRFDARKDNQQSSFNMDIVVAGGLSDSFFLQNFLKVTVTIGDLVHGHYDALTRVKGNPQNASVVLTPIAVSENLRCEERKTDILSMLVSTKRWHQALDLSQKLIPRFYIFDGFGRNAKIDPDDQIRMVADLIALLTDPQIKHTPEMRRLIGFSSYPEDFVSIISIATISFPLRRIAHYCCSHTLLTLFDTLLENPKQTDQAELQKIFALIKTTLGPSALEDKFADAGAGFNLSEMIARAIPTLHDYDPDTEVVGNACRHSSPTQEDRANGAEATPADRLRSQKTFFPLIHRKDSPEVLARFFNAHWERYPARKLAPADHSTVTEQFSAYHQAIDSCGIDLQETIEKIIREGVDRSLTLHAGRRRIAVTLDYLKNNLLMDVKRTLRNWEHNPSFMDLPDPPDMGVFRKHAQRFRKTMLSKPQFQVLLTWLPAYFILYTFALYPLLPIAAGMLGVVPDGQGILSTLFTYPTKILTAMGLSVLLVQAPILFKAIALLQRLRLTIKSDFPYIAQFEACRQKLGPGDLITNRYQKRLSRQIDKLEKKIAKTARKRGLLPRCIEEAQVATRRYWQARLKLSKYMWIRYLLLKAKDIIEDEIEKLNTLRSGISDRRAAILDGLRRSGDAPASPQQCTVIPNSTPFHRYFFHNDILPAFARSQRAVQEDGLISTYFIERYGLLKSWRHNPLTERDDILFGMAQSLYPVFERGLFTIPQYEALVQDQMDAFMKTLEERLSAGDQFRFFASLEENAIVCDSGIFIFCHRSATHLVKAAIERASLDGARLLAASSNPNQVTTLRILKDVSVASLMRYFERQISDPEIQPNDGAHPTDIWQSRRAGKTMEALNA